MQVKLHIMTEATSGRHIAKNVCQIFTGVRVLADNTCLCVLYAYIYVKNHYITGLPPIIH